MFSKIVQYSAYVVAAWAAWWLWNGPIQDMRAPDPREKVAAWQSEMKTCIKGEEYRTGATGDSFGRPEDVCADRLGFYKEDGIWYSRSEPRPKLK